MFVYNELLGTSRSMLLYPATETSSTAAGTYATKLHGCEQRYVGVVDAKSWSSAAISKQLAAILAELGATL